jgi:hypothetical protein
MPASTPWYQGAQVPLSFQLTDTAGNVAEAALLSSVVLTVIAPDQTTSTPAVAWNADLATYTAAYTSSQFGHHIAVWTCTDATCPGAFTDTFEVQPATDRTIVSLAEAKQVLHLTDTTEFDSVIQGYNASITDWIDYVCGPVVPRTVVERLPSRGVMQVLSKPPVMKLVAWTTVPPGLPGIAVPTPPSPMFPTMQFGLPYPLDQLYADPKTGIVTHTSGLPFIYGSYLWQYQAGRPAIPAGIYKASQIALEHLYMVERGGADAASGEDVTVTGFGFAVPNRAVTLLIPHSAASRMVAV